MSNIKIPDCEIIDAHSHIFPPALAVKATNAIRDFYEIPMHGIGSADHLLASARDAGVSRMVVCSSATTSHQVHGINDFIADECNKHPEFIGLGTLHPDMENAADEVDRIRLLGLHGIKLHPDFQQFAIDDRHAYGIYEAAGDLPILFHMGDSRYDFSNPNRLRNVLSDFPSLHAIAAHLGGYTEWDEAVIMLAHAGKNLRFDTSSAQSIMPIDKVRRIIEAYGTDNCFWGDDFPMWNHKSELESFLQIGFDDSTNEKILGSNFREYFGI